MPPPIPIFLAAYNPRWAEMAAGHAEHLRLLGSTLVTLHHIGSTSVQPFRAFLRKKRGKIGAGPSRRPKIVKPIFS
jgi:hypothetical protein